MGSSEGSVTASCHVPADGKGQHAENDAGDQAADRPPHQLILGLKPTGSTTKMWPFITIQSPTLSERSSLAR